MTQKVLKVGSSAAVTIPKKSLEELELKIGDKIYTYVDLVNKRFVVSKYPTQLNNFTKSDLQILDWTKKFINRYRKDLEALAKK